MKNARFRWKWIGLFAVLGGVILGIVLEPSWWRDIMSLFSADSLDRVAAFLRSFGWWAAAVSIGLMIFQAVAAPLPSFLIAAANGIVFGVFWGSIISWLGGMAGAAVNFYLAKWLGYPFVAKATKKTNLLKKVDEYSGKNGFFIILVARLIPIISFDFVSFLAGLSKIGGSSFLIATGIGQIPGTILYVVVGHDLANLQQYQTRLIIISVILIAIVILGKWRGVRRGKD